MLALDLDGTLLNSAKQVTPSTCEALRRYVAAGGRIVFVTGRNLPVARGIAQGLPFPVALVTHNGAIAEDADGTRFYERYLPEEAVAGLIRRARAEEFHPFLYALEPEGVRLRHQGPSHHPVLERYFRSNASVLKPVGELWPRDGVPRRAIQIVAIEPARRVQDALKRLPATPEVRWYTSGGLLNGEYWFLEGAHPEATKERALKALCDRWRISLAQVAAVGDNLNDLGLFRTVGRAIAVANAPEPVRRAAKWLVPSNDADGVAVAVARLLTEADR
ncbi:MAG: haloacid dehalogenase [Candidatus Poribacteria bacterium]|nr:MAG: haloacid dehalogenase [Candidatus Poribacteria bacterium]